MEYKKSGSKMKYGILGLRNKKKSLVKLGTAIGLAAAIFYPTVNDNNNSIGASMVPLDVRMEGEIGSFPIIVPTIKYGFAVDTFQIEEGKIQKNQTLGTLLSGMGMDMHSIESLVKNSKDVFNINRNFRTGKDYTILLDRNTGQPLHLILEPSVFEYIVFNLHGELNVQKVEREVDTQLKAVKGEIASTLWAALSDSNVDSEAAANMEDALECYVDFSHTKEGDKFKLLFEERKINGKSVGSGQLYAVNYQREGKDYYAFWFDDGATKGFFDVEGTSAKKGFLKSPLKYSRISSKFNPRRFHPILKTVRPHLGTDYAAPTGTPIYSVGEGVVEEVAYTKGNGKYVKIRHDKKYQTQYLHMSRYAKGIRRGTKVAQGQVIGYVGSTGLATGPHVCFRFWKNGKQVNHLREKLPQSKKMPQDKLEGFYKQRDNYLMMMEKEGVINDNKFQHNPLNSNEEIGGAAP
ncbi:MAG: peptidoglycan DD-metalloendopeptidase family protein [Saprospiraceae bacterium]|nr:peptidoglycan DD-metalloendopeptidase family protein [Saprospiraceae bacterium]MCF8248595.1 peptidoglycan DD-metalloendopeptidase family protein [Saprospiraceae bacterium]MCF8281033.1 peptidoglycan DD-metalloendopeptidase family protein [Bacteroidales bacterium]MCF8310328.1 peptidoglycan DD-metalloendopeptidase family protein [Saprospiraceae bacterium]MCF8442091.1 peptidoglycan DD-metalloendopeptidase family protein [Saprospiraceae bacterium]